MKKKVLVAMSGGVDSSVAALLLLRKGYHVTGVTMCLGLEAEGADRRGCLRDAAGEAARVCERLKIPHIVADLAREMREDVIDPFLQEYRRGRTPNPCVDCNRSLKFRRLLDRARAEGFDCLATGHYARIDGSGERHRLLKPRDRAKDQTYFLYAIRREDLPFILFPLECRTKEEVRAIAREAGLPVAAREESQDICFIPRKGYRAFIRNLAGPAEPGAIVDRSGREIGRHEGIPSYTVGQRSGLKISAPAPLYVVAIDPVRNRIVVGGKEDLLAPGLVATDVNLLAEDLPEEAEAKIRYRKKACPCRILREGNTLRVEFAKPQESVTPGQAVVLYRGDEVLGGGIIERAVENREGSG